MEIWIAIAIVLEVIMFLFIVLVLTHPTIEQKMINLEDRAILKIKKSLGK